MNEGREGASIKAFIDAVQRRPQAVSLICSADAPALTLMPERRVAAAREYMDKLTIKYRLSGKALPPRRITMKLPGWGGSPELRMENGSQPQPWHCKPFTDASTYGLELLYQYETECQIINESGTPRIEWDYMKEPG